MNGEAAGAPEAGPPALLPSVVQALGEAGLTEADYARQHYCEDGQWAGDRCGCPDDRCIGFHHFGEDDCGCFPVLLEQALDELASQDVERILEAGLSVEEVEAEAYRAVEDAQRSHQVWRASEELTAEATAEAAAEAGAELGEVGL